MEREFVWKPDEAYTKRSMSAYLGESTGDLSALLNPEAVEEIKAIGSGRKK